MAATPLETKIHARIAARGPIPVAAYMAMCLADPQHGYYMTRDPFGARGDFVTAPEVSQMFGELIGVWIAAVWQQMGSPAPVRIVELGPGRGTLMSDALRALKRPGLIIGAFAVFYACARSFSEFFREPDAQLGFLWGGATMGQLLSIPLFIAGICFIVYAVKHPRAQTN